MEFSVLQFHIPNGENYRNNEDNSVDIKATIKADETKSNTKLKISADRAPNTGDEADFIIWGILALCGTGIYTMLIRKRKVS